MTTNRTSSVEKNYDIDKYCQLISIRGTVISCVIMSQLIFKGFLPDFFLSSFCVHTSMIFVIWRGNMLFFEVINILCIWKNWNCVVKIFRAEMKNILFLMSNVSVFMHKNWQKRLKTEMKFKGLFTFHTCQWHYFKASIRYKSDIITLKSFHK